MTNHDIITDVIRREVGSAPNGGYTNDPSDAGGRTQYGISEAAHPKAWADGKVTEAEARAIYEQRYIEAQGFNQVCDMHLRHQLVDFGVHSGPAIAIKALQRVVGTEVDGLLGPATLAKVEGMDVRLVHNGLVKERVLMLGRIVQRNPSQLKYLVGWLSRALDFLI
jgi:lysozyme family protein